MNFTWVNAAIFFFEYVQLTVCTFIGYPQRWVIHSDFIRGDFSSAPTWKSPASIRALNSTSLILTHLLLCGALCILWGEAAVGVFYVPVIFPAPYSILALSESCFAGMSQTTLAGFRRVGLARHSWLCVSGSQKVASILVWLWFLVLTGLSVYFCLPY